MIRLFMLLTVAVAVMWGQGTDPKPKAADYPAHATAGVLEIGAENWGHGFSTAAGGLATGDFIAIEIALYSTSKQDITVGSGQFTLRVNKGTPLLALSTSFVAATMKYPDWQQRPELVGTVGVNDGEVVLGRQPRPERFPGDPTTHGGIPPVPRAPTPQDPDGMHRDQAPTLDAVVQRSALTEGTPKLPVSGYLFFPYRGKMSRVKALELIYEGPAGSASLALR